MKKNSSTSAPLTPAQQWLATCPAWDGVARLAQLLDGVEVHREARNGQ